MKFQAIDVRLKYPLLNIWILRPSLKGMKKSLNSKCLT